MSIRKRSAAAGLVNKKTRKVVPWVEVRTKIKRRNAARTRDGNHPLGRDAFLPLGDRLRSDANKPGKNTVTTDFPGGSIQGRERLGTPAVGALHGPSFDWHESKIHQWLILINHQFVARLEDPAENKPMVDKPITEPPLPLREHVNVAGHATLQSWVQALLARPGMKARCARGTGVSPQLVGKWWDGSVPEPANLKRLAAWAGVDLAQLQLLAHQVEPLKRPEDNERWTSTAKGAAIGRLWEEVNKRNPGLAEHFAALLEGQVDLLQSQQQDVLRNARKRAT